MSTHKKITRRDFLRVSAMAIGGMVLAACGPKAPTEAPTTAVQATKPPEATVPPAATPTPRPVEQPTNTPVPTAAAAHESPALAAQVEAGKLPKLAERLPATPLTLKPVNGTGKYGGRLKMASWWQDGGINAKLYGHSPLRFVDDGLGLAPGICEAWETNADNTVWTLHYRKGLKWSNGDPCTTADTIYWWKDMVLDPDHPDSPPAEFSAIGGVLPVFTAVDETTLTLTYAKPAPLTGKRLAMWVNGPAGIGPKWIVPNIYAQQFNPKYNSTYTNYKIHDQKIHNGQNPECPTLNSWMLTDYQQGKSSTYERNPYYYCVDSEGNQLPYIDGIDDKPSPDAQYLLLQIMQGSVDLEVHTYQLTLADIKPLQDASSKGNYEVRFWDTGSGTGSMNFLNYDIKDDKRRALHRTAKFKQALSYAIDRPTIKRIVYYDTGILTTGSMSPKAIEFNFNADAQAHYEKIRSAYVDYNPDKAKALLDEINVKDVDNDGFREFPDGSKYEFIMDWDSGNTSVEYTKVGEILQKNWKAIGLNVILNAQASAKYGEDWHAGLESMKAQWEVGDGPDHLVYPSWVVPDEIERWAPLCGMLRIQTGTPLENSEADKSPWDRQPPRFNKNDPQYKGSAVEKLHALYDQAVFEVDEMKRMQLVWQMNDIHINEGPFFLGTVANTPRIIILSKNLDNVPTRDQLKLGGFCNPWITPTPAMENPETFNFKNV